jgi:hypothetical protein
MMRWTGQVVVHTGEMGNVYKVLVGKPEGKRPLGRPRRKWEGNIRMDVDWIHVAQDREQCRVLANTVKNLIHHKM